MIFASKDACNREHIVDYLDHGRSCPKDIRSQNHNPASSNFSMCFDAHSLEKVMAGPKASVSVVDFGQHCFATLDSRDLLFAKYIDW